MTDDRKQLDKFKEAAREAECDMDEEKFDAALKKISTAGKIPEDSGKEAKDGPSRSRKASDRNKS